MTRVTIITATYNSAQTIADTLASVRDQDHPDIEHIIIDGASTDDTLRIVSQYPHVQRVISEKDNGIYDAMNKGLALAGGEIIGILNSDDLYPDSRVISDVVATMTAGKTDSLYGDLVYVDPGHTDRIVRTWRSGEFRPRRFLYGWMPPHPTFFVRKEVYHRYGLFHTELRSAADYELMLRFLFRHRISTCYLPRVLVRMRAGGQSNVTWANRLRAHGEDRAAWRLNDLRPYPFTLWLKPVRKIGQFLVKSTMRT